MKGKKLLLVSLVLGVPIVLFRGYQVMNLMRNATNEIEMQVLTIVMILVIPRIVCFVVAIIFNILAFVQYNKTFALVAAIIYTVGVVLNVNLIIDQGIEAVLCFVAFARMEKQ